MITGSIGMIPVLQPGDGTRGLYEPIHGSAASPDIAGATSSTPTACNPVGCHVMPGYPSA